jgi:hypothetical protein
MQLKGILLKANAQAAADMLAKNESEALKAESIVKRLMGVSINIMRRILKMKERSR